MKEIKNLIEVAETIIIHRHVNPDPDALGSQGGLCELLRATYPDKRILKAGEEAETLQFLCQMDKVQREDYDEALIIVTDTGNKERIDGNQEWMAQAKTAIKIDHHLKVDDYAPYEYVDSKASSTSELICDMAKTLEWTFTTEAARLLYAGIVGDTGRFLFSNTTPHTFEVASQLIQYDFDFTALSRAFTEMSEKTARLSGYVQSHFQRQNKVASIVITKEILNEYQVTAEETSKLVGLLGQIQGVEAWAFMIEKEDGSFRCRLRSKQAPIVKVAQRHDGGGHLLACGANAYSKEEREAIIEELNEAVASYYA